LRAEAACAVHSGKPRSKAIAATAAAVATAITSVLERGPMAMTTGITPRTVCAEYQSQSATRLSVLAIKGVIQTNLTAGSLSESRLRIKTWLLSVFV
jgi:hypothetical protein